MNAAALAAKHYPHSEYLQAAYLRAVSVVRSTRAGWVLDQHRRVKRVSGPVHVTVLDCMFKGEQS